MFTAEQYLGLSKEYMDALICTNFKYQLSNDEVLCSRKHLQEKDHAVEVRTLRRKLLQNTIGGWGMAKLLGEQVALKSRNL
jgi:hypothetical protein